MTPRIPGVTTLEACRPNYAKYFKDSEFGECAMCKPAYDNYKVFVRAVHELSDNIKLPETASLYVRSSVCHPTVGDKRHQCEENRCRQCSFVNYFIKDADIPKKITQNYSSIRTFEEEHDIAFLHDSIIE